MDRDADAPNLPLAELFRAWPEAARPFLRRRMACVGCPIAPFHTIRDACSEYRVDETRLRREIRAAIRRRRSAPPGGGGPSP